MKATLRTKRKKNGDLSLYLDFYPPITNPETGRPTRREFLKLYLISKPKSQADREHNKETKILAEHLRAKRQIDIQNGYHGFLTKSSHTLDFANYYESLAEKRKHKKNNYANWGASIKYFKLFLAGRAVVSTQSLTVLFKNG